MDDNQPNFIEGLFSSTNFTNVTDNTQFNIPPVLLNEVAPPPQENESQNIPPIDQSLIPPVENDLSLQNLSIQEQPNNEPPASPAIPQQSHEINDRNIQIEDQISSSVISDKLEEPREQEVHSNKISELIEKLEKIPIHVSNLLLDLIARNIHFYFF